MFAKETYVQRRAQLKKTIGSGVLLFLGNDEQGLNYEPCSPATWKPHGPTCPTLSRTPASARRLP